RSAARPAPPGRSVSARLQTTGTGASGLSRSARPARSRSSSASPTTTSGPPLTVPPAAPAARPPSLRSRCGTSCSRDLLEGGGLVVEDAPVHRERVGGDPVPGVARAGPVDAGGAVRLPPERLGEQLAHRR